MVLLMEIIYNYVSEYKILKTLHQFMEYLLL